MLLRQSDYTRLPRKISNQTLMLLDQNWRSFFAASRDYKKFPEKYTGRPKLPGYKDVKKGRFVAQYERGSISKTALDNGLIRLSKTDIEIPYQNVEKKVCLVRVVPTSHNYKIEVVYEASECEQTVDNGRYMGVDIGLNNLATVCGSERDITPFIINGRDIKSVNHYYNKKRAHYLSKLQKGKGNEKRYKSKRLSKLGEKRANKIKDMMHKKSKALVERAASQNVSTIVIGQNIGWKQNINIGSRNNQNFVYVPHSQYINMVRYKAKMRGIEVRTREESYTSKCSFLDMEAVEKHDVYKGKRIKRGLYRSAVGRSINADLNGAYNIMRKEFPEAYSDGILGFAVHPLRLAV